MLEEVYSIMVRIGISMVVGALFTVGAPAQSPTGRRNLPWASYLTRPFSRTARRSRSTLRFRRWLRHRAARRWPATRWTRWEASAAPRLARAWRAGAARSVGSVPRREALWAR